MKIVKPAKLEKGDLIGVISPASSPDDLSRIESGVKYFEKSGYRVEVGKNVGKYHGYLAGSDNERVEDIHYMFKKKNVKAIICVRGGYGTPRLLPKINFNLIKNNPKIFIGYSDITALQMSILQKTGMVTFAGPMLAVDFYDKVNPYAEEHFWRIITSDKPVGMVKLPDDEKLFDISKGNAKGTLAGGNLALLVSMIGSEFFPSMKDRILLLEDTGELPYRVDRLLNQLKMANVFNSINGVILGAFTDCNEIDPEKRTLTLGEVIDDYLGHLKIPVIYNFPHGHIKNNFTLPFGIQVKLNSGKHSVELTEGAVS